MVFEHIPAVEIFLSILGIGFSIIFCTTLCRACSRLREVQIEREVWRRSEHAAHPPPIYFIPFPRSTSQSDSDDARGPAYVHDLHTPPRYSTVNAGPPPSYSELGLKPDDLPPAYTEHNIPVYPPASPQPHTDTVPTHTPSHNPTHTPSYNPTHTPSYNPTHTPSYNPTHTPSQP